MDPPISSSSKPLCAGWRELGGSNIRSKFRLSSLVGVVRVDYSRNNSRRFYPFFMFCQYDGWRWSMVYTKVGVAHAPSRIFMVDG